MSRAARLPVLTLLLLAVLLAGCGDSGEDSAAAKNTYVKAINNAQDRFQRGVEQLQRGISTSSTTPAQDRRTLTRLAGAIDGAVAELRRIDVPKSVASLHQRLIDAVASYRAVVRSRRAAVGADDPRKLLTARTAFSSGSQQVNERVDRAISAINAALQK